MFSTITAWSSRSTPLVVLCLCAAPVGCVDRAIDEPAASDGATSSVVPIDAGVTEEEEAEIIRRRCELYFICDLHPWHFPGQDIDQAGCEQYFVSALDEIRMDPMKSPECVPALLDYYACSNELPSCHGIGVTWAFSENASVCAAEGRRRYCEADCGCPYDAP